MDDGWERFFDRMLSFLRELDHHTNFANESYHEYVIGRLEVCIDCVSLLKNRLDVTPSSISSEEAAIVTQFKLLLATLLQYLRELHFHWSQYLNQDCSVPYSAPLVRSSLPGRPKALITHEQLVYLRSMSFSWAQISRLLGVSYMTVYRRRHEFGLVNLDGERDISDENLQQILQQLPPSIGQTMAWGRLRSMGYQVTRERVRQAMRTNDPIHTALRWEGEATQRRPYSVPGPNSLWHIDGHHKLIRWKMVTHGAIDGYSRLVVFLKCSGNNRASTVYDNFLTAVKKYGLPSRIRCDEGGENTKVATHMLRHCGLDRQSILVGSSVHNQRIERLWRDMHRCAISLYYRLFYYMEQHDLLSPINSTDLFALHYIFLPRINRSLEEFVGAWNNHAIRTEHGQTPNQLFTARSLQLQNSGLTALDFFDVVTNLYGADDEPSYSPYSDEQDDDEGIEIPEIDVHLTDEHWEHLQALIDPLSDSNDFGIQLFLHAKGLVQLFTNNSTSS